MPDGVVKWCDMKTGEAEIVRGGRLFHARAADMEPVARRAGAHVHFDIRRVHGTEQAIDVRLRTGTRVSHHQHRFGTLAGARRVDTKGPAPYAHTHPEIHRARTHPLEVARAWSTDVAQGDVSSAFALYAPDAKVHIGDRSLSGRSEVQAWLEANPLLGLARHAKIHGGEQVYGADAAAVVSWEAIGQDEPGLVINCRIAHGQIAEQWVSEPEPRGAMLPQGGTGPLQVALTAKGDVGEDDKVHAERMILQVIERLKEPVLFARVKLVREPDPARLRPVLAQVASTSTAMWCVPRRRRRACPRPPTCSCGDCTIGSSIGPGTASPCIVPTRLPSPASGGTATCRRCGRPTSIALWRTASLFVTRRSPSAN